MIFEILLSLMQTAVFQPPAVFHMNLNMTMERVPTFVPCPYVATPSCHVPLPAIQRTILTASSSFSSSFSRTTSRHRKKMSVSVPCMLAHGNTRSSKNPNHPNRGSSSRSSSNNPNQKPILKPKTKKKAGLKDNMSIEEYFALDESDDDDGMDDQTSIHTFVSCPTCMASHMVTKEFLLRDVDGMEDGRGKEKVQKTEQKLEQKQGKRLFCNACETHFIATVDMLEEI